jgi:Polysaccharide deacetylase
MGSTTTGKCGTLLLFWDYDTQWGADRSRSGGGAKDWGHLEFSNTERLLEVLEAYKIKACFAVVGAAALPGSRPYHDPGQVRRIFAAGHEIASHSFRHTWLPGLDRAGLLEELRKSKDALEQCTGAPVVSFVPPYNQPFDYACRGSFSLSERLQARSSRSDLGDLCQALHETGFRFCRISYRPFWQRAAETMLRRQLDKPRLPEQINGITCMRINAPCGFTEGAVSMLRACSGSSGVVTIHGHPHSISLPGAQNIRFLEPFLAEVSALLAAGRIRMALPGGLITEPKIDESVRYIF